MNRRQLQTYLEEELGLADEVRVDTCLFQDLLCSSAVLLDALELRVQRTQQADEHKLAAGKRGWGCAAFHRLLPPPPQHTEHTYTITQHYHTSTTHTHTLSLYHTISQTITPSHTLSDHHTPSHNHHPTMVTGKARILKRLTKLVNVGRHEKP